MLLSDLYTCFIGLNYFTSHVPKILKEKFYFSFIEMSEHVAFVSFSYILYIYFSSSPLYFDYVVKEITFISNPDSSVDKAHLVCRRSWFQTLIW